MALQDLTPQLRTRLSRMERAVGWFVLLALGLLVFGFVYYAYNTAERKGWFKTKAPYFTYTDSAAGLKVGDPVKLMGLAVGEITKIEPMPPENFMYNMYVEFEIQDPYYGYLWTEGSRAKINTADLLGQRVVEVTKGTGGYPTYVYDQMVEATPADAATYSTPGAWVLGQEITAPRKTNLLIRALQPVTNLPALFATGRTNIVLLDRRQKRKYLTGIWDAKTASYRPFTHTTSYWLPADETPALSERVEALVSQVEHALPNIINLTNQLTAMLTRGALLTSNLNYVAVTARPAVSNLAVVTAQLNHPGALGEWLLPTNIDQQLSSTLNRADDTLATANTNLVTLANDLERSLNNLADLTAGLNTQVQVNSNILSQISEAVVHADQFVQGLKHHWLLRSAFKTTATNAPAAQPGGAVRSPKHGG